MHAERNSLCLNRSLNSASRLSLFSFKICVLDWNLSRIIKCLLCTENEKEKEPRKGVYPSEQCHLRAVHPLFSLLHPTSTTNQPTHQLLCFHQSHACFLFPRVPQPYNSLKQKKFKRKSFKEKGCYLLLRNKIHKPEWARTRFFSHFRCRRCDTL